MNKGDARMQRALWNCLSDYLYTEKCAGRQGFMPDEARRHVHGYEWKGTLYPGSKKGKHNGLLSFM